VIEDTSDKSLIKMICPNCEEEITFLKTEDYEVSCPKCAFLFHLNGSKKNFSNTFLTNLSAQNHQTPPRKMGPIVLLVVFSLALVFSSVFSLEWYWSRTVFDGDLNNYNKFISEGATSWFVRNRKVVISGVVSDKMATGLDGTFPWETSNYIVIMGNVHFFLKNDGKAWTIHGKIAPGDLLKISGYCQMHKITNCTVEEGLKK
jgi:ribosomal protein S27E